MFALIENGAVKQFPYNLAQLKKVFPNVSFPKSPDDLSLQEFGMFRVFNATQPALTDTQVLEENPPVFSNEDQRWTQVWQVREMTAEEVQQRNDNKAAEVRTERNEKLSSSDWTQVLDAPVDQPAWVAYRQALRDVTKQAGFPWTVEFPTIPA